MSGDGGSPKMKNLMKAPIKMTTDSWPRIKPWVKEKLRPYVRSSIQPTKSGHSRQLSVGSRIMHSAEQEYGLGAVE
jgi:hypothetical protein